MPRPGTEALKHNTKCMCITFEEKSPKINYIQMVIHNLKGVKDRKGGVLPKKNEASKQNRELLLHFLNFQKNYSKT